MRLKYRRVAVRANKGFVSYLFASSYIRNSAKVETGFYYSNRYLICG